MNNLDLDNKTLATSLIQTIKISDDNFRTIIRKFSINLTKYRDNILKKFDLNINDWINEKYSEKNINDLEKYILSIVI
jgi:hypothetical protein